MHLGSELWILVFDGDEEFVELFSVLDHRHSVQLVGRLIEKLRKRKSVKRTQKEEVERRDREKREERREKREEKRETNHKEGFHFKFLAQDLVFELEDHRKTNKEMKVGVIL